METSALKAALADILEQADTTGSALLCADQIDRWPEGVVEHLASRGWLVRSTNETGMTCDGCEQACWVEPDLRRRANGSPVLVHCCDGRGDIGLVELDATRLVTWRLDFAALASALAQSLGLLGAVRELVHGRAWRLGSRRAGGRQQQVFFAHGLTLADGLAVAQKALPEVPETNALLLVPARKPNPQIWPRDPGAVIPIVDQIDFSSEGPVFSVDGNAAAPQPGRKSAVRVFAVPTGTRWEKVVIRIVDDEHAELQVGTHKETRHFAELGMRDARRRDQEPNAAWAMLLILARHHGELRWGDQGASDNARSHMKILRRHLRELFGLTDDPIDDYKHRRCWQTRFTLVDQRTDE
jgi:hypothetical protein